MFRTYLLVDFENVQPSSLGTLVPAESEQSFVKLFAGEHQSKVDLSLARALQPFGPRAEYIQIAGNGKDALDFHIAYYVGRLATEYPGASFIILSRDTGFDPLIRHMTQQGVACTRVPSVGTMAAPAKGAVKKAKAKVAKKVAAKAPVKPTAEASEASGTKASSKSGSSDKPAVIEQAKPLPDAMQPPKDRVAEIVRRLVGLKAGRPGTVKTLRSSVMAWFKPRLTAAQMDEVLEQLTAQGLLTVTGTKVAYSLP
jgi:hypothetical protein